MPVAKVIEIIGESQESWEDAVKQAVKEASKTVKEIRQVYVEGMQVLVENGKLSKFRVDCKITFVVK